MVLIHKLRLPDVATVSEYTTWLHANQRAFSIKIAYASGLQPGVRENFLHQNETQEPLEP
jgi:hypothetical protein